MAVDEMYGVNTSTQAEVERDSHVQRSLMDLEKRAEVVAGLTENLSDRLGNALRPNDPKPNGSEMAKPDKIGLAPLATRIDKTEVLLEKVAYRLRDALDRLEL